MSNKAWEEALEKVLEEHSDLWEALAQQEEKPILDRIYFFDMGQVVVFDEDGKQVPALQTQFWNALYCGLLEGLGWRVEEIERIEFVSTVGRLYHMHKKDGRWRSGEIEGEI